MTVHGTITTGFYRTEDSTQSNSLAIRDIFYDNTDEGMCTQRLLLRRQCEGAFCYVLLTNGLLLRSRLSTGVHKFSSLITMD